MLLVDSGWRGGWLLAAANSLVELTASAPSTGPGPAGATSKPAKPGRASSCPGPCCRRGCAWLLGYPDAAVGVVLGGLLAGRRQSLVSARVGALVAAGRGVTRLVVALPAAAVPVGVLAGSGCC